MSDKPEALRLADALEGAAYSMPSDHRGWTEDGSPQNVCTDAAAELRRLHTEYTQLRDYMDALNERCIDDTALIGELVKALHYISLCSQNSMSSRQQCGEIARTALAKSEASNGS